MQTPMIHLNGSGANLTIGYEKVFGLLQQALQEMANGNPHMRDYYPMANASEAFQAAQDEHQARMDSIQAIISDYKALMRATRRW